jgi:uronate dehydrogenase
VRGDLAEPGAALEATRDVDCIVHLAGIPRETGGTPEQILRANVLGCHALFEAARANGARRLVFASSNHVIGFYRSDRPVGTEEPVRPRRALRRQQGVRGGDGRLYADKFGMEVACLRIGAFRARPGNARELGAWISHRDIAQLAPPLRGGAALPLSRALRRLGQYARALGRGRSGTRACRIRAGRQCRSLGDRA